MKTKQIIQMENTFQLRTYSKFPIVITKGYGMYVSDSSGKKYLDLYGGHAVTLTGHCHKKIVSAIKKQSNKLIFYSNVVYNDKRAMLSKLLVNIAPKNIDKVFFCNSGAESNENAIKLARKFTGKEEIISMVNSFHGRTLGSLSVTGITKYRSQFNTLPNNVKFAEFGDIESLKKQITKKTAAIIIEPIQSMAGIKIATQSYYQNLRKICDEKKIVLIFDEVQTGFGRTGKMFAGENWNVSPDIITVAKGIASGFPMGAVLIDKKISKTVKLGEYGTTFGGGPLACATALASVNILIEEKLANNASLIFNYIKSKLIGTKHIKEVLGLGCLIGIKFDVFAKEIQEKLLEKGIITGTSMDAYTLRLIPPLIIQKRHVDYFYKKLLVILEGEL